MADSRPFKNCFLVITQQLIDFGEILHREVEQHEGEQHRTVIEVTSETLNFAHSRWCTAAIFQIVKSP